MVSIIDAGIFGIFNAIFIFLLVFALVYGILSQTQWFGKEGTGLYAIIALMAALMATITTPVRNFIGFIAPWYVALFVVLFFILFCFTIFGLNPKDNFSDIIKQPRVYVWIIILAVIVFIAGLASSFGQGQLRGGTNVPQQIQQPNYNQYNGGVIGNQDPIGAIGNLAPYNAAPQAGQPGSTATPDFGTNLINTFYHPKVLGVLVTFLVAALAVFFLSTKA